MSAESKEKYFIETTKPSSHFPQGSNLIRHSKSLYVTVDENVEGVQNIDLLLFKFHDSHIKTPASNSIDTVKPVIKEVFYEYYYLTLKYLNDAPFTEGEYYLFNRFEKECDSFYWFSTDEKNRLRMRITIWDTVKEFNLRVDCMRDFSERPNLRKKGKPITGEEFKGALKLTLQFLYDPENYHLNYADFWNNYKQLLNREGPPTSFESAPVIDNTYYTNKILARIASLEKRLLELDSDSAEERMKMRGEIEGLRFAVKVLQSSERALS